MKIWDYSVHVTLGMAATLGILKAGTCLHGALGPLPTCSSCFAQGTKTAGHSPPSPLACPQVTELIRLLSFLSEACTRAWGLMSQPSVFWIGCSLQSESNTGLYLHTMLLNQ